MEDVKLTQTGSVPSVPQGISSIAIFVSLTPKDVSNIQAKIAQLAETSMYSRMENASTGNHLVWLFWEEMIVMISKSILLMSGSPSTTLITCLLLLN